MPTILVPLDGSAVAEHALPYARLLAAMLAARVRLLRVFSEEDVARVVVHDDALAQEVGQQSSPEHLSGPQLTDVLRQRAASYLAARAKELSATGAQVEVILRDGSPAEQIVDAAEHDGVSLIAMATHGYSGLRRWALGSVADKVVHAAPCPVFLARAGAQAPADGWQVKRILVPLDGSALAEQALQLAIELAHSTQAELILLQVVIPLSADAPGLAPFARLVPPSFAFPDTLRERAHQHLAAVADHPGMRGITVTPVVVFGFPAEEIVDEAARHHADLIVMATHGYSGLRRWALGSVADKVLHATATPLLLVRAQQLAGEQETLHG